MKKSLAAVLCSTALIAAPAAFAQTTGHGGGPDTGTPGNGHTASSTTPPLTPSQTETSEGAIVNPPPLDRSGNPEHVSDKEEGNTGVGDPSGADAGENGGSGPGDGGQDGNGTGPGTGDAGDAGGSGSGSGGS